MKYDTNLQILRRLMFCSLLQASFAIKRLLVKNCNSKLNLTEKRPRNKGNFLLYQKRLWHGKINSWMKTWKIQNQISKFKWHAPPKILGENISSYFEIDSGKLTEQIILEIFLGSTYVEGWPAGKIIGKHILKILKKRKICISSSRAQAYETASNSSSKTTRSAAVFKRNQLKADCNHVKSHCLTLTIAHVF